MLVLLPRPKFSFKWRIDIIDCPKDWSLLIQNALIWSLSQEKKFRDRYLEMEIRFVNKKYMDKMLQKDFEYAVKHKHYLIFKALKDNTKHNRENYQIGHVMCNSENVFLEAKNKNLFEIIVREFTEIGLILLDTPENQKEMLRRKILAKFSLI